MAPNSLSRSISVLLLAVALPGCATYMLPGTRMESPEALGSAKTGQLDLLGIQNGLNLLGPQVPAPPPDPKTGKQSRDTLPLVMTAYAAFTLPVGSHTDLSLRLAPYLPPMIGVRHQLYGPTASAVQKGEFSISWSTAAGLLLGRFDGAPAQFILADTALPIGYRLGLRHLLSISPGFRWASFSGERLPRTGSAIQLGGALGYQYETASMVFRIEQGWANGSVGELSTHAWLTGASVGFRIDRPAL